MFVQLSIFGKIIEAVCDSGASVSCLSSSTLEQLRKMRKIPLEPSQTKLVAANKHPINIRGTVRIPFKIGPKHFEHVFYVLEQSEADCLIGLDFLRTHKCDPLISQDKFRFEDGTQVPLFHRKVDDETTTVFRVVVSETISVPPGYAMIVPAHIADWSRPLHEKVAIFEPNERFDGNNDAAAPSILFNYAEQTVPVTVENSGDETLTLYEKTTLGTSEIVPVAVLNNVVAKSTQTKQKELDKSYDLKHVTDSVSPEIPLKLRQKFAQLVHEFEDVFSKDQWDLGRCDATTHRIDLYPGSRPIKLPNRRMPIHHKKDLQEKIDALMDKQLISPCHSPYSAPAMLVPKKNGKLRLVIDYRQLNNQTIKSCWPIPSIEEIFDTLEGSAYFTTIDMSWGFYQIPMDENSQEYTAFSTPFGSFKWLRMPMGLTNSPPTFQSLMEIVLSKLIWKTTVPYLDDCIIFSATAEEHLHRLREVLERFRAANLKINPLKSEFFRMKVQFLGHIISKKGLQVDPEKVSAVKRFPVPTNQTQVKSFLGLCSYYRRYVKNFADIARPLHKASETSSPFKWTEEAHEAFEKLKSCLLTTPILAFPSTKDPFILYTDASQTAMGAVLAQIQDGKERAICYASKAFTKAQTNYSATKRELLAIVQFTRHFRHYLLGRKFTIVTDHSALRWMHSFKDPDGLTARWLEKLAAFDYEVQHRPGKSIGHADGLSRMPPLPVEMITREPNVQNNVEQLTTDRSETEWPNAQPKKPSLEIPRDSAAIPDEIINDLTEPNPSPTRDTSINKVNKKLKVSSNNDPATETAKGGDRYNEVLSDLFTSTASLAHCVSADFKMNAGIARSIKRKYPTDYPKDLRHPGAHLWPQWLPSSQRFIYHLLTKERFFHKPTYSGLRASLASMCQHAETHGVSRISMPQLGCGIDKLEWPIVRQIIQEVFATSNVSITVHTLDSSKPEPDEDEIPDEDILLLNIRDAQEADESLKLVRNWVRRGRVPKNNDLQGSPLLAWKLYIQFHSLYLSNDVLCRKFEGTNGELPYLQQIVPPALVDEILSILHASPTGGHLGTAKLVGKVRQRFWWPGFKEDIKLYIKRCLECQRRSNPPQTHRHSLSEWKASYPFHHIGIDFMGPLPVSNGNRVILLIGDHFTKWYEAVPLPNQKAETTASALIEHWISRFGCPHSIHSDQGRNFESQLYKSLLQLLKIEKTRTTAFRPQSNAVIERMNRTLQNMLAKCVNEEQNNWSQQLPYVMMAYRSSVHESTGYTPQFLVQGQEISLPIDIMYPNPEWEGPSNVDNFVYQRQKAFQRAFELVRNNLNKNQLRRNALYNKKVHGPTYEEGQKVLLHNPAVPVGKTKKFFSPWRGPYIILKCLNEVTYKIQEISTKKELVVHYDRLKVFHEQPATSNVPTRNKTTIRQEPIMTSNVPTRNMPEGALTSPTTAIDHSECGPYPAIPVPSLSAPATTTPLLPSVPVPHHTPVTPPVTPRIHIPVPQSTPSTPVVQTSMILPPSEPSSTENVPTFRHRSRQRARNLIERAAVNLRHSVDHPYNLRNSTRYQRNAEPSCATSIPSHLTDFNSPPSVTTPTLPRINKSKRNFKRL